MQLRWLRRALENLDDEAAFIAKDSPPMAAEFVRHLRNSAAVLADHPNMGRAGRIAGTRKLVIKRFSYILPYRVRDGAVDSFQPDWNRTTVRRFRNAWVSLPA